MPSGDAYIRRQRKISGMLRKRRKKIARPVYSVCKIAAHTTPAAKSRMVADDDDDDSEDDMDDVDLLTAPGDSPNLCKHCGTQSLLIDVYRSRCANCGITEMRNVVSRANIAYTEKLGVAPSNYRRYIHFRDVLKRRVLSAPVDRADAKYVSSLESVAKALILAGIASSIDVSLRVVQRTCRELGVKGQNMAIAITEDLSGVPSPHFSPYDYNRLYCLFQAMQGPFEAHKPSSRTNFLHYNMIAFKVVSLLGFVDDRWLYVYFWPMLGSSKIVEFDDLFNRMCRDPELNWEESKTYRLGEARNLERIRRKECS